ncbi:MAG: HAD hydrolase-like protein [Candidatus Lokiarchaeota archaeon]|nr:HAD hydrolase-like protein [Candidatus Lokiarchaeota archaeon]
MTRKILISFDLDFTLIDNQEGILNSFKYVFKEFNIAEKINDDFKKTIGLPLEIVFKNISNIDPKELINSFRKYYAKKGIYQVVLFPEVANILNSLKKHNIILGIVTSKKQELAKKLLENLQIIEYFDFIIGESLKIKSKTDLNLKNFFFQEYPNYTYFIIGDHTSDRKLAEMLNCKFIGVLTGTHTKEELLKDSSVPVFILDTISQLSFKKLFSFMKGNE